MSSKKKMLLVLVVFVVLAMSQLACGNPPNPDGNGITQGATICNQQLRATGIITSQ